MKATRVPIATALLLALSQLPALADCQCVADGKRFHHGDVVCLRMPAGNALVQCGMVLNNSAWLKLQDGCPVAEADSVPDLVHAFSPAQPPRQASLWDHKATEAPVVAVAY